MRGYIWVGDLITEDADQWHQRLAGLGLPVTDLKDQPWGMREFTLTDPNGNHIKSADRPRTDGLRDPGGWWVRASADQRVVDLARSAIIGREPAPTGP